jgi:TonB family protein
MLTFVPFRLFCLLALSMFCSFSPALHAQSTEADLNGRLKGQPLYLRGCWRDDNLHFDSAGQLKGNSAPVAFTLSGFELRTLHLKSDKLILEGRRIGLELANDEQRRVPLNVGKVGSSKDESMHLEIAVSPTGNYGPALDAIFVNGLSGLVPSLPPYWRAYGRKHFALPDSSNPHDARPAVPSSPSNSTLQPPGLPSDTKPMHVGGPIKAPKLIHAAEPEFNDAARGLKYSGKVLIYLWLTPEGKVTNMSLVRPVGLGLDERALAAVQNYVFSPAMLNDKPVLVELNIEVNFQIF